MDAMTKMTEAETERVAKLRKMISRLARQDGTAAMRQANDCRAAIAWIRAAAESR